MNFHIKVIFHYVSAWDDSAYQDVIGDDCGRLPLWALAVLMPGTHYVNAHLCTSLRLSVKKNDHSANPDTL